MPSARTSQQKLLVEASASQSLSSREPVQKGNEERGDLLFPPTQHKDNNQWIFAVPMKPALICLIETHVKQAKIAKFVNSLLPGWHFEENYSFSELGKIWILWHPSVKVVILSKSLQMVTCEVHFPENPVSFIVSFVYASNEEAARRSLWGEIVCQASRQSMTGKAWAVLGDFNQILVPADHSTRIDMNMDRAMREFSDSLLQASLMDLVYRGSSFTWWNKRKASPVAKKLDRILVNDDWQALFPFSTGFFGAPIFSDHSPGSISLNPAEPRQKKPFKFFNFLLKNQNFLPLICESWHSINVVGSDMYRVAAKLRDLKKIIREFSKENYSNLEKRVKEALEVLSVAQVRMLSSPSIVNADLELEAARKWDTLSKAEESFFYQKSRITWLDVGDQNSAYFHRMAATRQSINHIHFLDDDAGNRITTQLGIKSHCVEFFKDLLGSDVPQSLFVQEDIKAILNFECSADQRVSLDAMFTKEEIKDAFFSLPRNKSSGPDGYSAEFFISCWSVVGVEVTAAVSEFFSSGKLLKQWNSTCLVLIPKIQNASKVSDFRPISCLNTIYKVISKLLAFRLKSILPSVVSHSQSAFMPGRLLSENVLLASEIVQGYNRRNIEPRAMLKIDLRKAFDTVRWDFVLSTLSALGIPEKCIGWIRECVCTPTFSISVNGMSDGFFKSTRGLRQGDPLSPYLFVLAMEVFSRLLVSRFESGYISYHPKASALDISHLMFADDVMVFFDGSSSSLHGIYEVLDDFAGWSGLTMNREKTLLFHAGLSPRGEAEIAHYGFPSGTLPVRYLGLPLMSRKLRINEYSPLLEKITNKFRGWATKSLSFAGRTQLLKSGQNSLVKCLFTQKRGWLGTTQTFCLEHYLVPQAHLVTLLKQRFFMGRLATSPQEFMLKTHSHIYSISVNLNDDPTIKVRDFELPGHRYHLEGTYDGNFFMYDFHKGGSVVSNPLLRQTKWIPADEIICSMSMGYDGSRPEKSYSIIGDNSYNTDHLAGKVTRRFAVFEFATNAWKITNHTSFHKESHSELIVSDSDRVSLNGNLYWTAYNYNETGQYFIIMLDFSKEIEKRRIFCILPFKGKTACTHTRGLAIYKGDRFSALEQCARTREIEIWVTKNKIGNGDDEDNVVWIKFMTVSIPNFPLLSVVIDVAGEEAYHLQPRLFEKIIPERCRYEVLSTKAEIRLAKPEIITWSSLKYGKGQGDMRT
ncbi:Reverse transcriptase domain [Arabidopsis thaliana x Arabidopsis arenosa]|uniref:Reverse transcriptase domain n=1 Tax=Arabidopsis thaliana x Arabidopsis arenosa TaxID=1240361 RepID=A0A8T2BNQ9_9BRAS|nr:Reverse transcriptase domain [Arabidopsis thaliana x Arabidopsis arenosa]